MAYYGISVQVSGAPEVTGGPHSCLTNTYTSDDMLAVMTEK